MKLFINEIYIQIIKPGQALPDLHYDLEIGGSHSLKEFKLAGNVLVKDGSINHAEELLSLMEIKRLKKLKHIVYVPDDYERVRTYIKNQFRVIKAGGGLVVKEGQLLLIHRLGLWDLPKGKLEKDEKTVEGAVREVEEECNILVRAHEKLCSTWHTYLQDGRKTIKKTTWYLMECLDDSRMAPQVAEGITDIAWFKQEEAARLLKASYASIREVYTCYQQQHLVS